MKRLVVLLLGIVCMCIVAGCGKSDKIEGTWVPKNPGKLAITSIVLTKQNDFSYQGVINYTNGQTFTSTFQYFKDKKAVVESGSDINRREKELKRYGAWRLIFNDDYTEAKTDDAGKPECILIKEK